MWFTTYYLTRIGIRTGWASASTPETEAHAKQRRDNIIETGGRAVVVSDAKELPKDFPLLD